MSNSDSDYVLLKAGLALPVDALRLAWDLEARGFHLTFDGDVLSIGPRARLTDDDRALIRRWKSHLRAISDYVAPEVQ